jgi:hypothetical protein
MAKIFLFLGLLVGPLAALSPVRAGWSDVHAGYARPVVASYGQYAAGPVHFRALPRYYHVIYWPAAYYYRNDLRYRFPTSAGCGCW